MTRLKELRLSLNLTQKQLADELNLTQSIISDWETGRTHPDANGLMALADYFDVSVDYLIGYVDEFGNKTYKKASD